MSSRPPLTPAEAELAADFAAGLLDGADHDRAARLAADDPAFRAEVERWTRLLAPMLDEVVERLPPPHVLSAIERRIAPANENHPLEARLRRSAAQ